MGNGGKLARARRKEYRRQIGCDRLQETIALLWSKQAGKCYFCQCDMDWSGPSGSPRRRSLEHLQPISRGGIPTDVFNMVLACRQCNYGKGDLTEEEFAAFKIVHGRLPTARERVVMAIKDGRAIDFSAPPPRCEGETT